MPGIELSGERRLLTLWLILSLLFGLAYYLGWQKTSFGLDARQPFVQRFERAYYAVFWSRPFLDTQTDGLEVGVIAPRYISSLIDSEMWVWVRREPSTPVETPASGETATKEGDSPAKNPDRNSVALSPLIVIDYTPNIENRATPAPTPATSLTLPTPTPQNPIEAQILLREGENQNGIYTQSRSAIMFTDIYPGETAARLVWVRLIPQAYRRIQGDPTESIYLSEQEIIGSIQFGYTLWESPTQMTDVLDFEKGSPPEAMIDTRQAVMRGFARTLLLPPWSNGLLIGLGLISAFMINLLVNFIDLRLAEGDETERLDRANKSRSGNYESTPKHKETWRGQLKFWLFQIGFWAFAITTIFLLVVRLTEVLILCPMVEVAESEQLLAAGDTCAEWPLWPSFYGTLLLAIFFFYIGYIWRDTPPKAMWIAIKNDYMKIKTFSENSWTSIEKRLTMSSEQGPIAPDGELVTPALAPPPPPSTDPAESVADPDNLPDAAPINAPEMVVTDMLADKPDDGEARRIAELKAAKKIANDLTSEIKDLHRDLMSDQNRSLEDYISLAVSFRNRQLTIVDKVNNLSLELNWTNKNRKGPPLLRDIDNSLSQLERYIPLAIQVDEKLINDIREGDSASLERLLSIRSQITSGEKPFNLNPAKSQAEALIKLINDTERYFQTHFVDLHTGISDDGAVVEAIRKMEVFRDGEGSVVKVRFFNNKHDVNDVNSEIMYLSNALDIGLGRLSIYRMRDYQAKFGAFAGIRDSKMDTMELKQRALEDLERLLNDIDSWPDSLPGWEKYPEHDDGADSFPRLVDNLKRDLEQAIDVLKGNFPD